MAVLGATEATPGLDLPATGESASQALIETRRLDIQRARSTSCMVDRDLLKLSPPITLTRRNADVHTIHGSDADNRMDLVFVGDGYTQSELSHYADMVQDRSVALLAYPPFDQYSNWINIHRVDVVSPQSGVDNDPNTGQGDVDTAMDMYIQGSGTGGDLLLMDWQLAHAFANLAPDMDCIIASGNTTHWCGAGTQLDIATYGGDNWNSFNIMMHEIGHSLMHLADEYYTAGAVYTGGEQPHRNISIMNEGEMSTTLAKWSNWIDHSLDDVGVHGAFEGAHYCEFGINRPTGNSLMNWLEYPLNGPGFESAILQLHLCVDPIVSTNLGSLHISNDANLSAEILHPIGHQLDIEWKLNGTTILSESPNIDLADHSIPVGRNLLALVVTDPNPLVRDERLRSTRLTSQRTWVVDNGTSADGACCLSGNCTVMSRAACEANTGLWIEAGDCISADCFAFDACMEVDSFIADVDMDVLPSLDIIGCSVHRMPNDLLEARIELRAPPLAANDPSIGNRMYRLFVDTDAPYMTTADWDDVDQSWGAGPIGGTYRGQSTGVHDTVHIEDNTIIMHIDPAVLGGATEFSFVADAVDWDAAVWDTEGIGRGSYPRWDDVDGNGLPDDCEMQSDVLSVCSSGCTYSSIQDAIDAAADGQTITIGPGTYAGTGSEVANTMGKSLLLQSSHGPEQTFIDGEGNRRGILCDSGEANVIVQGLTVKNCSATSGGGIRSGYNTGTQILDCIFQNNSATWGGAVNSSSDMQIINCVFESNSASSTGGAIDNNYAGHQTIVNCVFTENSTPGAGGAIHNYYNAGSTIHKSSFTENTAFDGGAMKSEDTYVEILECAFTDNEASDSWDEGWQGRGGSAQFIGCTTYITDSLFLSGVATYGSGVHVSGGTLYAIGSEFIQNSGGSGALEGDLASWTVHDCEFVNNSAFWDGAAINTSWGIELELSNCVFDGNQANFNGGAIRTLGATSNMTSCTFTNNVASTSTDPKYYGDGGAILALSGSLTVNDAHIAHNEATRGTAIHVDGGSLVLQQSTLHQNGGGTGAIFTGSASLEIAGCNFVGNTAYWDGGAINAQYGQLNVDNCVFEGNSSSYYAGAARIYASDSHITNSRFADNTANEAAGGMYVINTIVEVDDTVFCGNTPDHVVGDIDADNVEFLTECPPECNGDYNGDDIVNVADLLAIIAAWNDPYNVDDLLLVISQWNTTCP